MLTNTKKAKSVITGGGIRSFARRLKQKLTPKRKRSIRRPINYNNTTNYLVESESNVYKRNNRIKELETENEVLKKQLAEAKSAIPDIAKLEKQIHEQAEAKYTKRCNEYIKGIEDLEKKFAREQELYKKQDAQTKKHDSQSYIVKEQAERIDALLKIIKEKDDLIQRQVVLYRQCIDDSKGLRADIGKLKTAIDGVKQAGMQASMQPGPIDFTAKNIEIMQQLMQITRLMDEKGKHAEAIVNIGKKGIFIAELKHLFEKFDILLMRMLNELSVIPSENFDTYSNDVRNLRKDATAKYHELMELKC